MMDYAKLAGAVKRKAEVEMQLFDMLHPVIRRVITEHSAPVQLLQLFQENKGSYQFAQEHPYEFAQRLRQLLDRNAVHNAAHSRAAVASMAKETAHA